MLSTIGEHLSRGDTPPGSSGDPSDQSEYLYDESTTGLTADKPKAPARPVKPASMQVRFESSFVLHCFLLFVFNFFIITTDYAAMASTGQ